MLVELNSRPRGLEFDSQLTLPQLEFITQDTWPTQWTGGWPGGCGGGAMVVRRWLMVVDWWGRLDQSDADTWQRRVRVRGSDYGTSDDEASNHEDASDTGVAPKQQQQVILQTTVISNIKLPILKKEEYDIWAMEMEHYLEYIDNDVLEGNSENGTQRREFQIERIGIVRILSPDGHPKGAYERFSWNGDEAKEIGKPSELVSSSEGLERDMIDSKITFAANEIYEKDKKLKRYRRIGMKAVKEKEQLQKTLDSWKDSSKNLWEDYLILDGKCHMEVDLKKQRFLTLLQLNTGRTNINSVRHNINTGRTNVNPVMPRVNTGSSNVNTVRSRQPVPNKTSNNFSPKRPQVNQFNQKGHFSKSYSSERRPFAKTTAQMSHSYAVKGNWGSAVKTSAGYNYRNSNPNSNCDSGPTFIRTVNAKGPQGRPKPEKAWMPDENQILLKVPRHHNMYSFDMKTPTPAKEPQQEKKVSSTDTSEDNPKILAFKRELEEIALKHLGKVYENTSTSTPSVNTGSNLPTEIEVSPTPTLRIHNIHPKSQILGDPKSAVQTRSKVQQKSGAHALFSFIQKQQRNNHKDQQHCLFACFLSQEEPKKISEALQDDSWVQAMQEELL
ncbi:hypothetical protein Tco_0827738 [Tanacetum coccineum]